MLCEQNLHRREPPRFPEDSPQEPDNIFNIADFPAPSSEWRANIANPVTVSGQDLADRLRRALVGKRRSDIIKRSGVSEGTIARVLKGEPTRWRTLASLADALGVSSAWMIHGTFPMAAPAATLAAIAADIPPERPATPMDIGLASPADPGALGAAIRIALRNNPAPQSAGAWRALAQDVIELYAILADQEAALSAG